MKCIYKPIYVVDTRIFQQTRLLNDVSPYYAKYSKIFYYIKISVSHLSILIISPHYFSVNLPYNFRKISNGK